MRFRRREVFKLAVRSVPNLRQRSVVMQFLKFLEWQHTAQREERHREFGRRRGRGLYVGVSSHAPLSLLGYQFNYKAVTRH